MELKEVIEAINKIVHENNCKIACIVVMPVDPEDETKGLDGAHHICGNIPNEVLYKLAKKVIDFIDKREAAEARKN